MALSSLKLTRFIPNITIDMGLFISPELLPVIIKGFCIAHNTYM